MYTRFFGLRCLPFEDRAEAQFFFPAAEHEETLAAMEYEAHYGTGIGLVLGEAGTGKTLLLRTLLSRLHATDHVVVITVPANGASEVIRECCKGFGVSLPSSPNESRRLSRLRRHLGKTFKAGHRAILVVDQAEYLTPANLCEIETLADLQSEQGRLLRVILAGHPRFRSLLEQPEFARIRQQTFKEHVLSRLTESETADYVRHRLHVAGAGDVDVFDARALGMVHASSGGVPRLINQACNAAMLAAYGAGESRISASITAEVTGIASDTAHNGAPTGEVAAGSSDRAESSVAPEFSGAAVRSVPQRDVVTHSEPAPSRSAYGPAPAVEAEESRAGLEYASCGPSPATSYATAVESRLLSLIERAERAGELLARGMARAADSSDQVQRRVERLVNDAEERVRSMESRLGEAASRTKESLARVQRVERACKQAEGVESRITGFAEQLADRVDDVQVRVSQLLENVAPVEEARVRLEETIGLANAARGEAERDIESCSARWHQARETAERSIRGIISTEIEACRRRAGEQMEEFERRARGAIATAGAEVTALGQRAASAATNAEAVAKAAHSKLELDVRQATEARDLLAKSTLDELRKTMQGMSVEFENLAGATVRTARAELAKGIREAQAQATTCEEAESQLAKDLARAVEVREGLEGVCVSANEAREALRRGTVSANESAKSAVDATEAGVHLLGRLGEATTEAEKAHEGTIKAVSAAERTIGEVNQALERFNESQIDTNMLAARLDSDTAMARQVVDALAGLVATADQKIDALSSTHAAASHLHERLTRTLVSGHQFVERAEESAARVEKSVGDADTKAGQLVDDTTSKVSECADESIRRVEKWIGESDAQAQQLSEKVGSLVRECTAQIERWEGVQTAIAKGKKRLHDVSEAGSHIAMELALLVEQGGRAVSSLNEGIEKSSGLTERMDAFAATLETAGAQDAELRRVVESGRTVREELSSVIAESDRRRELLGEASTSLQELIRTNEAIELEAREAVERVDARVTSLGEADASLHSLMQTHEQIEQSARETLEQLGAKLTLVKDAMETAEPLLNEYLSRIGAADEKLTLLGDRAAVLGQKIAEGTVGAKAIVTSAQAHAEHLDRVCTAVQKVLAGLSRSSLQAREQTEDLRRAGAEAKQQLIEFTAETDEALKTLHEWLQEALRVQARLERAIQQSPTVSETHPAEPLRRAARRLGTVERSATIDVEAEPGAAKAREVDAGFERKAAREGTSRADEIARLIAEAKQTEAAALVSD